MKKLFFISTIVIFCSFIRTFYGLHLQLNHLIFVSSVVNPNNHEIDELKNLLAFPLIGIDSQDGSSLSNNGTYEIIFSSEPENIITIPATNKAHYSMSYFENLVKNRTSSSTQAASLKGLRKALEISSKFPPAKVEIALAINTEPEDGDLLGEILDSMMKKNTTVFVLKIDKKTSIFQPEPSDNPAYAYIAKNRMTNLYKIAYHFVTAQTDESLGPEYSLIRFTSIKIISKFVRDLAKKMTLAFNQYLDRLKLKRN